MLLLQRIVAYGCLGILVEVLFTGLRSVYNKHWAATSTTYLWMLPIYGLGGWMLETTHRLLNWPMLLIAVVYVIEIYLVEFTTGYVLQKLLGKCPWDYGIGKFTIMGLVRLDYAGYWYILCLLAHKLHPVLIDAVNVLSRI